jgi:hypothetical protein
LPCSPKCQYPSPLTHTSGGLVAQGIEIVPENMDRLVRHPPQTRILSRTDLPPFRMTVIQERCNVQVLKPLVYSFLENADKSAWLVLVVPEGDSPGIPEEFKDRQATLPSVVYSWTYINLFIFIMYLSKLFLCPVN